MNIIKLNDLKLNKQETICFTGSRPKNMYGYDRESYIALVVDLEAVIVKLAKHHGFKNFVTGGAQGFDQLVFWAINNAKTHNKDLEINNICIIPFKGQERRWANTGLFSIKEYNLMLNKADKVVYLEDHSTDFKQIVKYLDNRNKVMLDLSRTVLGLKDGRTWTGKGGTANCLRDAEYKGLEVITMNLGGEIRYEN